MTIQEIHTIFLESSGISTDTRTLSSNQLYVALSGDNFNGNTFAQKSIEQGAYKAIIDDKDYAGPHTILVENTLTTLQQLASYHRTYLNIPIIALTGSNGKTTTKELINVVLSQKYKTTATYGNLNNHIGVPLTLLSMTRNTEIGIVEMGANHQKEIEELCRIAQPNYGLITNFGKAHLEGFGGIEGVIKGKSELYTYLKENNGIAFINDLDTIQMVQSQEIESRKTLGSENSDYPITLESASPTVQIRYKNTHISTQLIGAYNFSNTAIAVAIGAYFKLPIPSIKKGLESYLPENNRSQLIHKGSQTIILDAYNANPTSMEAALRNLKLQKTKHSIAFIGDMFEVGETAQQEHQEILILAQKLGITKVFAIGPSFGLSKPLDSSQQVYKSYDHFVNRPKISIPENSTILIKGSRGMKMERIIEWLS